MASYRMFCSSLGLSTSRALLSNISSDPALRSKGRHILTQCLPGPVHSPHEQKEKSAHEAGGGSVGQYISASLAREEGQP